MPISIDRGPTLVAVVAAVFLILAGAPGYPQSSVTENAAIRQFQSAADDYAFLHRRLQRGLGPREITASSESVQIAMDAMATVIRAARPEARPGDLFTPAVQVALRARVAKALRANAYTSADVYDREAPLKVNGSLPRTGAKPVLPCILEALPRLPEELEYRIVGSDLVLIDVHAGLIVEILPLPASSRPSRP